MKVFDEFKKDFYEFWGILGYSMNQKRSELRRLNLLSPAKIRKLKMDDVDGRQWNDFEHINSKR